MTYVEYFATVFRSDGNLHVLFKPTKQSFCKVENRGRNHPAAFTFLPLGDVDVPAKKLLDECMVRGRAARPYLVALDLVLLGEPAHNSVCMLPLLVWDLLVGNLTAANVGRLRGTFV